MKTKGLDSTVIKIVAIICMFIDHLAASWIEGGLQYYPMFTIPYWVMRFIGRVSFPIFCFFIVEGFFKTRCRWKYALRLLCFALISEVPFDLAMFGTAFYWGYQNVFFTLFLGLLVIWASDEVIKKKWYFLILPIVAAGMAAAWFGMTDYDWMGIVAIFILYILGKKRIAAVIVCCVFLTLMNPLEITCALCIPLLLNYNGQRGRGFKYFFYAFYPAHLLILGLLKVL